MTREDALTAMNGATLIGVADKLGVKVSCNKTRTSLKEAKSNVIARILEAEAALESKEVAAPAKEPKAKKESAKAEAKETAAPAEENKPAPVKESKAKKEPKEKAPAKEPKAKKEPKEKAPAEEPAEIKEAIEALDNIYDTLNDCYFDGLLPKADISVKRAAKNYDPCTVKKDGENYEISIGVDVIGVELEKTAAALLHAMVHIYCQETEIVETCQKGRYHNAKFKKECEDRDLAVEHDTANGYVYTAVTEAFAAKISEAGLDLNTTLAPIPAKKNGKAERA